MTVAAGKTPYHRYSPGAAMAAEAIPFDFGSVDDLTVQVVDGGALAYGTDYSIGGDPELGTATITALIDAGADEWELWSETPRQQALDLADARVMPLPQYERELDRRARIEREIDQAVARAPKVARGEEAPAFPSYDERTPGYVLGFDADRNPVALETAPGGGTAPSLTDLAGPTGATLVGYGDRSVDAKLDDIPHLFDEVPASKHNAIVAGTNTDDLSGYANTLLALGRPVRLPDLGLVHIAETLDVPSRSGLIGHAFGCTIKALPDFGNKSLIRNVTIDPASNAERDEGLVFTGFRIDGNKANNSTATEFSHGLRLQAVNGAQLDVWSKDAKGDGVLIMYARPDDGPQNNLGIGCTGVSGRIRSETAARQGVTLACAEAGALDILADRAALLGVDIEPDHAENFVRDYHLRIRALQCGQANAGVCGALLVMGTDSLGANVCDVRNIDVNILARDCLSGDFGAGVSWRDVDGLRLRGIIDGQDGIGVQSLTGGLGPSYVDFGKLYVKNSTGRGMSCVSAGDVLDGAVRIRDAGGIGAYIKDAAGGTLKVDIENSAQQGLYLDGTDNMTFPDAEITGSGASNVYLTNTASGNRLPGLKSTGATGYGLEELAGCNDNQATGARISGNGSGAVSLAGSTSFVESEPVPGKANLTFSVPGTVPGFSTSTGTISVPGAGAGDLVEVTPPTAPPTNYAKEEGFVSTDNNVTVRYQQVTGAPAAAPSGSFAVTVTHRWTA